MHDTILFIHNLLRFDPYLASMGEIGIKTTDTVLFLPNLYRFDPYLAGMGEIGTKTNANETMYIYRFKMPKAVSGSYWRRLV